MPEPLNDHVRSRMKGQRTEGTKAESAVRKALHARGLRFRVNYRPEIRVRSKADIAFTKARLIIYVDGCFWHGCPEHFVLPRNNANWWSNKIESNRARDRRTVRSLEHLGWEVIRIWEHELIGPVVDRIERIVRRTSNDGEGNRHGVQFL